jgi:hypothetical protein
MERVRVDKEVHEHLPDPENIFQKDNELYVTLKLNSECELLQYTYLGAWPGFLEALPWDKIELLDFFLESLIFSTPLGQKALNEAARADRVAEYAGWEDEVNEEEDFEQALDENTKLEVNETRHDDSFHANDFMDDDEGEENPELGRKALDNRRQSMEGGLARVGILNTLKKPNHKKKKSKTPSPKRGTNIPKAKQVGTNTLTTHTGAEKPSIKTT